MRVITLNKIDIIAADETQYEQFLEDVEFGIIEEKINWLLGIGLQLKDMSTRMESIESLLEGITSGNIGVSEIAATKNNAITETKAESKMKIGSVNLDNMDSINIFESFKKF